MGVFEAMAAVEPTSLTLGDLPVGSHATVVKIQGDHELARRLLGLGLRSGSELDVLQRRGRSVVVVNGAGTRIALGASVAEKVLCRL